MAWVTGPLAIAAAVLVVGGLLELRDSRPARDALAALGLPAPRLLARLSGPVEIALGAAVLVVGGWLPAVFLTGAYLIFVAVLAVQLQHEDGSSCGCFGRLSARPSPIHLVVDAALALVGAVAVASDPPGLLVVLQESATYDAVLLGGLVAVATGLLVVVLTVLPATSEAARPPVHEPGVPLFQIRGSAR